MTKRSNHNNNNAAHAPHDVHKASRKGHTPLTLGVFAPSSRVDNDALNRAAARLAPFGVTLMIHPQVYIPLNQSAGSRAQKTDAFHALLQDAQVDAILTARGGNRSIYMLDHIDYDLWRASGKPIIGFSDVTTLLNAAYARAGCVGIHGPCLQTIDNPRITDTQISQMVGLIHRVLDERAVSRGMIGHNAARPQANLLMSGASLASASHEAEHSFPSKITAPIIGGNLSVFQALIGTPFMPPVDGAILIIEDVGDQNSRYDRMLGHLRQAGILERIAALIVGDVSQTEDKSAIPFGFTLDECLSEAMDGCKAPIIRGAPFGHVGPLWSIPIGLNGTLAINSPQDIVLYC